jgi:predicted acetyltransferase
MHCNKGQIPPPNIHAVSYRMLSNDETLKMADLHRDVYVMSRERAARWYSLPYQAEMEDSFGAFVGEDMVAGLSVTYYPVRLFGRTVLMGGVGGVATQPEHRRHRHVAKLLELALERMRKRGVLVSMLYPFKYSFYRKYGWEHASDNLRMVLPMSALSSHRMTALAADTSGTGETAVSDSSDGSAGPCGSPMSVGSIETTESGRAAAPAGSTVSSEFVEPTSQCRFIRLPLSSFSSLSSESSRSSLSSESHSNLDMLARVYDRATSGYNCIVARTKEIWERKIISLQHIEADGKNMYIYLGVSGSNPVTPVSYVIYSFSPSGDDRRMDIREAFAVDTQSYRGLLEFMAGHDSQAHEISWDLPVESPIRHILAEPRGGQIHSRFMFRVVDVKGFFESFCGAPSIAGWSTTGSSIARSSIAGSSVTGSPITRSAIARSSVTGSSTSQCPGRISPFILEVFDGVCPWNNKVLEVDVRDTALIAREVAEHGTVSADLAMDITTFSQVACGYTSAAEAYALGIIKVAPGRMEALRSLGDLFPRAATFCADYF